MARDVGFKTEEVMANGMSVFWRKGYQGTSMRDLTKATKLHPGSFYHSFGNKRDFFLAVANYYYKDLTANINKQLQDTENVVELLRGFFIDIVIADNDINRRGCLLINTLIEATQDPELQAHLSAMFSGLEEMFYWILVKGQKLKQIKTNLDCRAEAQLLVNDYYGLRVHTMTEKTISELTQIVETRLSQLAA